MSTPNHRYHVIVNRVIEVTYSRRDAAFRRARSLKHVDLRDEIRVFDSMARRGQPNNWIVNDYGIFEERGSRA